MMNRRLLRLLLLAITCSMIYADSQLGGYFYERPSVAFSLPQPTESATTSDLFVVSLDKPNRQRKPIAASQCHDNEANATALASLWLAERKLRPEQRRLMTYTELLMDSAYFEPSPAAVKKLRDLLRSAQATKDVNATTHNGAFKRFSVQN